MLAEPGPGRGTLMADVLRATRAVPGFHAAAQIWLVEASPVLRDRQRQALAGHAVQWADRVEDLPDGPLFLLANEFFDALPIRQFTRGPTGWDETVVGLSPAGALQLGRVPVADPGLTVAPGTVVEICPAALPIAAHLGTRIATQSGLALILDYGGWGSRGDTFQALYHHTFADPLAAPGEADLTAHVDFRALAAAARPAAHAFTTQGTLLNALGLQTRAERLAARLSGPALQAHLAAARRLTHPDEMGTLFKALALYPPGAPTPPGLA